MSSVSIPSPWADRIVQASTNFCANRFFGIGDKRAYNDYVDSVKEYYRTYNRVQECTDVENTLRKFREQLENLNSGYFALLTEVLDNLLDTPIVFAICLIRRLSVNFRMLSPNTGMQEEHPCEIITL